MKSPRPNSLGPNSLGPDSIVIESGGRQYEVPCRRTKGGVAIQVRVQPRSSRKGIDVVDGQVLKVRLTAPPAEGEANAQLIEVLASALGVGKGSIKISRGGSSRNKTVELSLP